MTTLVWMMELGLSGLLISTVMMTRCLAGGLSKVRLTLILSVCSGLSMLSIALCIATLAAVLRVLRMAILIVRLAAIRVLLLRPSETRVR